MEKTKFIETLMYVIALAKTGEPEKYAAVADDVDALVSTLDDIINSIENLKQPGFNLDDIEEMVLARSGCKDCEHAIKRMIKKTCDTTCGIHVDNMIALFSWVYGLQHMFGKPEMYD